MLLNKIYKLESQRLSEVFIILLAILCFSYSTYIAIYYANQVPLDDSSFRQTQTALTSYWLVKNGFSLAYETPVAGPPWSIPFEFPIYQYIVALISQISGYSLNITGRLVSYFFLVLCLIPARSITKSLNLSDSVFYIFTALLFSSPIYLYWGRTFMIETTAVFFSVAAIKYFIDIILADKLLKHSLLFLVFISLAILQKATTGLPVLALLSFIYLYFSFKETNSVKSIFTLKKILLSIAYFGIPLMIGVMWTLYTDQIKILNGLGVNLTSSALNAWNWGTLSQRLSLALYKVIGLKIFYRNISGVLGLAILIVALLSKTEKPIKSIIIVAALMGLVPLFLFTNLHIMHDYYHVANTIFLIYAVAVSLNQELNKYVGNKIIPLTLMVLMVISNYVLFFKKDIRVIKQAFTKENSRDYAVAEILKKEIPQDKYFIAFGNTWSSTLPYLAERKSFTVPIIFKQYQDIALNPEHFIEEAHLGSVVICPSEKFPTINELNKWSSTHRNWKIGEVFGCYIAVPTGKPIDKNAKISTVSCQGAIESVDKVKDTNNLLAITGWTTLAGEKGIVPEKVYVTLAKQNEQVVYFETLQVNRPDINEHFAQPNNTDSGFSRLINTDSLAGKYKVSIVRLNQGHLEACQFQKEILINGESINE